MKELMGGLLYDTETATEIGRWEGDVSLPEAHIGRAKEIYYKTPNGRYFYLYEAHQYIFGRLRKFTGNYQMYPMSENMAKQYKLEGKIKDDDLIINAA